VAVRNACEFVYTNQYGEPYATSYHLGIKYWRPVLEKLGIRYRVIYQARHTFATLSLLNTADINYNVFHIFTSPLAGASGKAAWSFRPSDDIQDIRQDNQTD